MPNVNATYEIGKDTPLSEVNAQLQDMFDHGPPEEWGEAELLSYTDRAIAVATRNYHQRPREYAQFRVWIHVVCDEYWREPRAAK